MHPPPLSARSSDILLFVFSCVIVKMSFETALKPRLSQDEDLVDDTLDDMPLVDEIEVGVIDVPPPPVDFDDSDGYDDGYDLDEGGIQGAESEGMY